MTTIETIGTFLKMILKNGGASFVLTLLLAWLFREYFDINPVIVVQLLEWMLWMAFIQAGFSLIRGELFTTLQKWRDYKEGKAVAEKTNGQSVSSMGKEIGLETVITLVEKASDLREKISKTPEQKESKSLEKDVAILDKQIAKILSEMD